MNDINMRQLRAAVSEYTRPNTIKALFILAFDMSIYLAAIAGVVFFESMILKVVSSIVAGTVISSMFVIAHDAAHDSFTGNRNLNRVIARLTFLPSLHNFSLWLIAHNRIHHQFANVKSMNSWSPLSKQEYDNLSDTGKFLEKIYRTIPGFCLYYLVERWWKDKFYPFKRTVGQRKKIQWLDFLLVCGYLVSFLAVLTYAGLAVEYNSPVQMIMLGFVIPFLVWNFMGGFTVYQHHTHETILWTRSRDDRNKYGGQEEFTMYVKYPAWYNQISHNIMVHTAHHVDPRIPSYYLSEAQEVLQNLLGEEMHKIDFSVSDLLRTLKSCKLYDYDNHSWQAFDGTVTAVVLDQEFDEETEVKIAA